MNYKCFLVLVCLIFQQLHSQNNSRFSIGFNSGFGSEFNNRNYTFTNEFYKIQLYYTVKQSRLFEYQILIQPEVNFASHQLLNFYFVKPEEIDFEAKRALYTQLKSFEEYVLNIGFFIRKPVFKNANIYLLISVGPMIATTETERMSKGFAFADVGALGFSYQIKRFNIDFRPSVRHVSNGGLQSKNSGYNTKNIELGIAYQL